MYAKKSLQQFSKLRIFKIRFRLHIQTEIEKLKICLHSLIAIRCMNTIRLRFECSLHALQISLAVRNVKQPRLLLITFDHQTNEAKID